VSVKANECILGSPAFPKETGCLGCRIDARYADRPATREPVTPQCTCRISRVPTPKFAWFRRKARSPRLEPAATASSLQKWG